jgi:hypothetical protein
MQAGEITMLSTAEYGVASSLMLIGFYWVVPKKKGGTKYSTARMGRMEMKTNTRTMIRCQRRVTKISQVVQEGHS